MEKVVVLRLTWQEASPAQLRALRAAVASVMCMREDEFELEVVQVSKAVGGFDEVLALVTKYEARVLEAVLPLPLLAQLLPALNELNVPVLRAVMDRIIEPDGTVRFEYLRYERIRKIHVEVEPLERC